MNKEEKHNMASCMLSILDSLKLYDNNSLELGDETLSEMMFRKMKGYNIDLNKELGFTHLKPVTKPKTKKMRIEHLINDTYQVTNGDSVFYQGQLSDCKLYLNQNKD